MCVHLRAGPLTRLCVSFLYLPCAAVGQVLEAAWEPGSASMPASPGHFVCIELVYDGRERRGRGGGRGGATEEGNGGVEARRGAVYSRRRGWGAVA